MKKIYLCLVLTICLSLAPAPAQEKKTPSMTHTEVDPRPAPATNPLLLKAGDNAEFAFPDKRIDKPMFLCSSYSSFVKTMETLGAGDMFGLAELAERGEVFLVSTTAKMLILEVAQVEETEYWVYKVRVLSGEGKGKSGYILESFLKRAE
jgi:hypothetical protein